MSDPFKASGSVSVTDRLECVKRFNAEQCDAGLQIPYLQETVKKALQKRLKKLNKEV